MIIHMCVRSIKFSSAYTIFRLEFGIDLTLLCFVLLYYFCNMNLVLWALMLCSLVCPLIVCVTWIIHLIENL
jgi:hypothetical protein